MKKINDYYPLGFEKILYNKLYEFNDAIRDFKRVVELDPNDAEAYNNIGLAYFKLKHYTQAIRYYSEAINLNPQLAKAYAGRGHAYALLEKPEKARKDLLEAVKLNPAWKSSVKQISDQFKLGLKLD